MSDYTPEEQEFIGAWVSSHSKEGWGGPVDIEGRPRERMAEARRGIAKVKADALREAADHLDSFEGPGGRRSAHDQAGRDIIRIIRARADRIEENHA